MRTITFVFCACASFCGCYSFVTPFGSFIRVGFFHQLPGLQIRSQSHHLVGVGPLPTTWSISARMRSTGPGRRFGFCNASICAYMHMQWPRSCTNFNRGSIEPVKKNCSIPDVISGRLFERQHLSMNVLTLSLPSTASRGVGSAAADGIETQAPSNLVVSLLFSLYVQEKSTR